MEYTENAKMLMGYVSHEDSKETNILDYDDSKQDFSSSSDDESAITDDQIYPETKQEKITWHEQIRMMQLRSHINQLLNEVKQAQYIADKTREELKKCKTQIKLFEEERDKLFVEIKEKETENNRSAIDRLCATHERVCKELEAEQRLEAVIMEKLDQAEYDLARAELERGKFILAEDDLLQRELKLSEEKAEMAMIRHQKEQFLAQQALAMKQKENKIKTKATLEAEKRHRHAVEEAEKSHNRANKYLSKTMAKLKMRQEEEAEKYKTDMNRKMEMLLKLREDIAHNKENLRAIKAKDKASEDKKKAAEELEREKILSEGGNPDHALLVKKRKNEMEKLKQQFEADQQVKKVEIVQKILREEENLKKKKKLQPYLWEWPDREKSLRVPPKKPKIPKLLQDFIAADDDVCASKENIQSKFESTMRLLEIKAVNSSNFSDNEPPLEYPLNDKGKQLNKNMPLPEIAAVVPNVNENNFNRSADFDEDILAMTSFDKGEEDYIGTEDEGEGEEYGEEHFEEMGGEEHEEEMQTVISQAKMSDSESEIEEEEPQMDLAQPEFEGLWNKQTKPYKLPKGTDQPQLTHPGLSKMEEEILKRTLEKTRRGIVTTQVAAGKEFKGPAFYSKPDIIHFKDFDVGKLYKKKVKITNVSYTLNFIKFIDISDQLKDFIKIQFDPPGHMSAGLTCDLMVIFKPMINEDLYGKVKFLTQTGRFEIPLICSTKKCNLSIDLDTIDFGTHVIGETIKRTVTLTNRGALGTCFTFSKVSMPPMPITAKLKSSEFSNKYQATRSSAWEINIEKESNLELEIKSSEMNESKSAASVLGKISETSEVLPQQTNMISVTRLSSHQISVSQVTNQNPASQAPSSQNDLQNEGPSLQLLYPSTSGRVDNSLSEKPPSTVMLGETNTPEPVTTEHLTYENNETVTEVNNTTTDTPFKKGGMSFSVSKQDTPAESQDWEDYCSIDGMTVGNIAYQELGPFSSVKLEIIWKPKLSGKVNVDFEITFSDPLSNPLSLEAIGTAIDVPVWVKRQCVDLQTCILDRLYQDTVIICNRASTALRLKFEVAPELKDHMEILPKTGYIQAQSQFSAQLKFLPRKSIYSDAPAFIEKEIGVLEAPVTIRVTDQTTPVVFTVQAVVTNSDIEISESQIDFGFCTIHESVVKRIELSNKSILPQHFGFVGLPEFVEVQPNDGFGTLLPLEKLSLDIIFSPKKAEEFKFELVCRTLINRDFKISCVGTGVHTPLELSKQVIHFGATSLFDKATTYLHVINNHVSANEFSHPVPRIGKGKICPVGPTSFHFIVPNDAPVSISPIVGTVQPGKRCKINVQFTPVLGDKEIKEEAEKMMEKEKMKENKIETMIKESIDPIISDFTKSNPEVKRKDKGTKLKPDIKAKSSLPDTNESIKKSTSNKVSSKSLAKLDKNTQALEHNFNSTELYMDQFQEMYVGKTKSEFKGLKQTTNTTLYGDDNSKKKTKENRNISYNAPPLSESSSKQSLHDSTLDLKASKLESDALYNENEEVTETQSYSAKTPGKEKSTSNIVAQSKIKMSASNVSVVPEVVKDKLDSEPLNAQSPEYIASTSALIRHFRERFQTFTIPCYIASGTASVPGELDYSVHNTLYLQIHCPAVKPPLLVISDGGKNTLNFGNVSIGQTSQKSITIQNISDKYLELKSTLVNPAGPFLMLNALRPLSPGAMHTILMTFTPEKSQIFQENFCIKSSNATLNLTLKGYGVSPLVNLSFSESVFDMGAVLSGEFVEKTFMIENTSILSIDYIIKQDSISLYHNENAHRLQEFLHLQTANKTKKILGTQNFNGKNVFDIVPMRGTIAGGGSQEITVTFAPDHESDLYADGVRVELFDEEGSHFFKLIGQGKSKMMYMEGYDQLIPSQESLALAPYYPEDEDPDDSDAPLVPISKKHKDGRPNVQASPPALITIKSMMLNDSLQPGSRTINVGCVRTMAVSQKKNGEFSVDGLQSLIQKGFTVEPQKGMVEAGVKKPIVFTWTPPANHDPNVIIEETATLTLKCDGTEQITLMIQAMVVTG